MQATTVFMCALCAAISGGVYYQAQQERKSDLEILQTKVTAEFEKQPGVKVKDISWQEKSWKEMVGKVIVNFPGIGDVTKSCGAARGLEANDDPWVWQCR